MYITYTCTRCTYIIIEETTILNRGVKRARGKIRKIKLTTPDRLIYSLWSVGSPRNVDHASITIIATRPYRGAAGGAAFSWQFRSPFSLFLLYAFAIASKTSRVEPVIILAYCFEIALSRIRLVSFYCPAKLNIARQYLYDREKDTIYIYSDNIRL